MISLNIQIMDHSAAMVMFELFNNGLVHSSDLDFIKKSVLPFFQIGFMDSQHIPFSDQGQSKYKNQFFVVYYLFLEVFT